MTQRLNPFAAAPQQMKLWMDSTAQLFPAIEHSLAELVKMRSSQINGCANCMKMHAADARAAGERQERLDVLSAWREAPYFSNREQAALAWTEALTLVAKEAPSEQAYTALAAEFSEEEQVQLTLLINAINGWNRLAVGFHLFYDAKPVREAA